MTVDKVFYTNGNDVMITDSFFTVKKKQYRLMGIIKHGLKTIRPFRVPGLLIAISGMLIAAAAGVDFIKAHIPTLELLSKTIDLPLLLIAVGTVLIIIGVVMALTVKTHYAVHISTAEGEADVIVSKQRAYITQIVNALNRAVKQTVS